jgi:hypothetical protein
MSAVRHLADIDRLQWEVRVTPDPPEADGESS